MINKDTNQSEQTPRGPVGVGGALWATGLLTYAAEFNAAQDHMQNTRL
eukprot:CAMPEP_0202896564 /NCGR_PEP_ID=MMETSP1392-20130828/5551_1 /ASSEMBLY_ACC=CAM_ASM_000868 /TAXON_ID=225041 /ORGANISM="Chlamydomonas chlamydogama, Strain SAG 11-48b" /LENGTH=47 /DNA_ID= /DNA_START= /DNA_END= /DNA_ORIENTATION=